jgi:tRNA pseudouridine32 synthase/23S rRNA pseudouridine746 synthase
MISPFQLPPPIPAKLAAKEVIERVHAYMQAHPESELHHHGKMFGVLVYVNNTDEGFSYIAAFSAQLDGSYHHDGFVPPVFDMASPPIGKNKDESQRMQRLLFAQYSFLNGKGETKNLLDIFATEKPIIPAEQWFGDKSEKQHPLPPSGAGECCAPKLLQYAFKNGLKPYAIAEFWVGASPHTEIRKEGVFYPPCSGRCVPILRHMLEGIDIPPTIEASRADELCRQIEVLYEDDHLLVVNKPSGLLSVPGKSEEYSVSFYLSELRGITIQAVHRLDQDTSGLLVLAKNEDVYKSMQAYFQRRDILKRYEAIVSGMDIPKEGEISLPLLPNPYDRPRQMVNMEHGKPAITRFITREVRSDGTVFIDLYPLTGRTHQLRVHAAHPEGLNAPIVGDRLYGGMDSKACRLMLHAAELRFSHPITKEEMHFCIPSDF